MSQNFCEDHKYYEKGYNVKTLVWSITSSPQEMPLTQILFLYEN